MTISEGVIQRIRHNDKNAIGDDFLVKVAVHHPAKFDSLEVTKFLVNNKGVSFNAKTNDENKPIHIAADF
ncbi:hypothetical protein [Wolbachia endosymbiont (group A) of Yponomeuta plumbellus]|uniref:hypothetical protein n=1 Tax=Wolbachia endosymbiont (group A) of Yponomeuta plumbellus TaxID=2954068 RepID=UPI002230B0D8|nr:hypothetical protein [Wolbachia endosymbiont (group A) of Yponomeuta plumbellus]